jgi:nitrogen fixation protein FixH
MAALLLGFFGVIVAVNVAMAVFAVRTFGGKVVENSYVASQQFNSWLEEARTEEALGWRRSVRLAEGRLLAVSLSAADQPLAGALLTAAARHPLGREADIPLRFASAGPGRYESDRPLPAGRWYIQLRVVHGRDEADFIEMVQ